jgi:hypothetical protein
VCGVRKGNEVGGTVVPRVCGGTGTVGGASSLERRSMRGGESSLEVEVFPGDVGFSSGALADSVGDGDGILTGIVIRDGGRDVAVLDVDTGRAAYGWTGNVLTDLSWFFCHQEIADAPAMEF